MPGDRAQTFATALRDLENNGDIDRFVRDIFSGDAALVRPETGQEYHGVGGAHEFWRQYLDQFEHIASEFSRVLDAGELGVLEWTSTGRLRAGAEITYRGASILNFDDDSRVSCFVTYYDTTPFTT